MPQIFEVGGCVRDRFLGIESKDIDFTFVLDDLTSTAEEGFLQMTTWLWNNSFEIFKEHPESFTIRARFPKDHRWSGLDADFVMARKELGYKPGTREPIVELGTLADDLARRDFTLNALAEAEDGSIVDLFDGQKHLEERILITPLEPNVTLMDDPLRMMRALRFAITKGFTIHPDLWEAMFQDGLIEKFTEVVSIERTREELKKMLEFDTLASIRLFAKVDARCPKFMEAVFGKGMWLLPTFKQSKKKK
jgi:poly(A) polymerase